MITILLNLIFLKFIMLLEHKFLYFFILVASLLFFYKKVTNNNESIMKNVISYDNHQDK